MVSNKDLADRYSTMTNEDLVSLISTKELNPEAENLALLELQNRGYHIPTLFQVDTSKPIKMHLNEESKISFREEHFDFLIKPLDKLLVKLGFKDTQRKILVGFIEWILILSTIGLIFFIIYYYRFRR
jgi:hypothetical protein